MPLPKLADVLTQDQIEFLFQLLDNEQVRVPIKNAAIPVQVYKLISDERKRLSSLTLPIPEIER